MPATLKELGEQLRQARESRKLSMQEASEITKISKRILIAFEQADRDQFPHPVYAKGFIKNYAKLLGLDAEEFGRAMGQAVSGRDTVAEPSSVVECAERRSLHMPVQPGERKRSWPTVLLILLLIAVLAVLVWYLLLRPVEEANSPHQAEARTEAVQPAAQEPAQAEPGPAEAAVGDQAAPAQTVTDQAGEQPAQPARVEAGAEAQTPANKPAESMENLLLVKAKDPDGSWVGVYDEEGEVLLRDFTVSGDESVSFALTGARSLRIGRVQGVDVWFRGKLLTLDGVGTRTIKLPPDQ